MKKQQSLIDRIKATLKIGDEGKVQNFIDKQTSLLKREIKSLNQNISVLKNEYENRMEDFKDQISDYEQAIKNAYEAINPEELKNNASIEFFAKEYWKNVETCERDLKAQIAAKEKFQEEFETKLKNFELQITERERRIENLN
jgi:predicted  nucleic acid-binding Zn-ribbon protein